MKGEFSWAGQNRRRMMFTLNRIVLNPERKAAPINPNLSKNAGGVTMRISDELLEKMAEDYLKAGYRFVTFETYLIILLGGAYI